MNTETTYERSCRMALDWARQAHPDVPDATRESFAADYAAFVDEWPALQFPDTPMPSPAEYAEENLDPLAT